MTRWMLVLSLTVGAMASAQDIALQQRVLVPEVDELSEKPPQVPFVPTPEDAVDGMLSLAEVKADDVVYDLGSGDGRIVIQAAKQYGARGVGVDINPERVAEAKANAHAAGVQERVEFRQGDLFDADIGDATVVTLYLLPSVNEQLKPKLLAELEPGTRIVSHGFDMGDWQPVKQVSVGGRVLYLWVVPEREGNPAAR